MEPNYRQLYLQKKKEILDQGYKIKMSRPWWLRASFKILNFFTGQNYSNYTQAIGKTIYPAKNWVYFTNYSRFYVLVHEHQHLKQFKKYSTPLMAFLYLFFPLPIGLAYFRAKFEREAMKEVLRMKRSLGEEIIVNFVKEDYIRRFSGATYLYPWPFKKQIKRWVEEDCQLPK